MTADRSRVAVAVESLEKSYADGKKRAAAVADVSFEVPEGSFFTLLGPSGCGKTTTMRCIAGLERIDAGRISIGGTTVSSVRPPAFVPPNEREIGMVFQSYAIWPHMTVFQNVSFPLMVAGKNPRSAEVAALVEEALALVKLDGYQTRMATQLSGGQQQRLALARALVGRPKLLLLDEPLSNLDARLRDHMRSELRALQQRLGITTIYVTHDQVEALSMSDRIAVMQDGRIVQEGAPLEMYQKPVNGFVAEFLGSSNIFEATVAAAGADRGHCIVRAPWGDVPVLARESVNAGDRVSVSIRPERIRLHAGPPPAGATVGRVAALAFLGEITECDVELGGMTLRCRQLSPVDFAVGDDVRVDLPPDAGVAVRASENSKAAVSPA